MTPWLRVGADVGYYVPAVRHGRDDHLRTIEAVFTDATAPGLARQPHFVHDSVFAEVDSRDAHGFPRRGGFYHVAYALWNDRTLEEYNFRRFDIVGSQFLSVSPSDVIALRLALTYANNAPGDRVPFYLMPYVGGGDTVRSFREFRFRDENAGTFNVELRHKIHSMVSCRWIRRFRHGRVRLAGHQSDGGCEARLWFWYPRRQRRQNVCAAGYCWRRGRHARVPETHVRLLKFESRRSKFELHFEVRSCQPSNLKRTGRGVASRSLRLATSGLVYRSCAAADCCAE